MDDILINQNRAEKLKAMVGFRNIAVYQYQKLSLEIVKAVIENEIEEIEEFSQMMLQKVLRENKESEQ